MYVETIVDQLVFWGEAEKIRIAEQFRNCNNHFDVTFVQNNLWDSAELSRFSFHAERFHPKSFARGGSKPFVFLLIARGQHKAVPERR